MESSSSELMRRRMKMASVSTVSLFLLCCHLITGTESSNTCTDYGKKGTKFTLPLENTGGLPNRFQWSRGTTMLLRKNGDIFLTGTENDITVDGSLTLNPLGKEHEGPYKAEVFNNDGTINSTEDKYLCVLDPVRKPTLTQKCADPYVTFTCTHAQGDTITGTHWLKNSDFMSEGASSTLTQTIKSIENNKISCRVSNQVSNETSNEMVQTCLKTSFWDYKFRDIPIWIFAAAGLGVVVLLIIIVICCCVRNRRKKQMDLEDAEELRLNFGRVDQQPGQTHPPPNGHGRRHPPNDHQHHHPRQEVPGHTGPRQNRTRNLRPKAPEPVGGHPNPAPRAGLRAPAPPHPLDDEEPPPLPQPRKKLPKDQKGTSDDVRR